MPPLRTTAGQLLVNEQLPQELRDYNRILDKNGLKKLLQEVAQRHPDKYREISHALATIGRKAAYLSGGDSFGLAHLTVSPRAKQMREQLAFELDRIENNPQLNDDQREELAIAAVSRLQKPFTEAILQDSIDEDNPLARQVISGSRGNKNNLAALRGGDLLYTDSLGRTLPVPITRSYSEGLTPAQYWAGSYGSRAGLVDIKLGTARAGYLNKQLAQAAHRLLVTAFDEPTDEQAPLRGFPVDTDDNESSGALLATQAGRYPRNTILTPKILAELRHAGVKRLLVRSPAVGGASDGGVLAMDAGVRERGNLPLIGEQVGMTAANALGEPLTQGQLGSKHSGGVAGQRAAVSGFGLVNQLVQVPKSFKEGAAHAQLDGTVQSVSPAPAGGQYITIDDVKHYVLPGHDINVRLGQQVEAGDVLTNGIPNPAEVVKHKGIGEGRRYFVKAFRQAFREANLTADRRNIELLSRGLIDHVRLRDEHNEWLPGDVVSYQTLERDWEPREGVQELEPRAAVGKYLEKPVLHHTIGTKIKPSMLQDFDDFGVKTVSAHDQPPPFEPEMIRGAANLRHDPDWLTKMFGSGLRAGLLKDVHRGAKSDELGTSFVPGLAKGVDFGLKGKVVAPHMPRMKQSASPVTLSPQAVQLWQEQMMRAQAIANAANANQLSGYGFTPDAPQGNWLQRTLNPNADTLGRTELHPLAEAGGEVLLGGATPINSGRWALAQMLGDALPRIRQGVQRYRANQGAQEYYDTAVPNFSSVYQPGQAQQYQVPEIGELAPLAKEWNQKLQTGVVPSPEAAVGMADYWKGLQQDPNVAWPDQQALNDHYAKLQQTADNFNRRFALSNKVLQQIREQVGAVNYPEDAKRQEEVLQNRWARGDITDEDFRTQLSQRYPLYQGDAFSANVPADTHNMVIGNNGHVLPNSAYDPQQSVARERERLQPQPTYEDRQRQEIAAYQAAHPATPEQTANQQWIKEHWRDTGAGTQEFLAKHQWQPADLGRMAAQHGQPAAPKPPSIAPPKIPTTSIKPPSPIVGST